MKREAKSMLCVVASIAMLSGETAAQVPDAVRGRLLYENHCMVCHTQKVHRRVPPIPIDARDLHRIVSSWAKEQKLQWSQADIADVVNYLERSHYQFEK